MATLRRQGECNNCGWCCQFVVLNRMTIGRQGVNPDSEKFYLLRKGVRAEDGSIRVVMHGFMPCSAHVGGKCSIYEERPDTCRTFPSVPEQVEGTPCSYWFEIVDERGVVLERRGGAGSPYPTPPTFAPAQSAPTANANITVTQAIIEFASDELPHLQEGKNPR